MGIKPYDQPADIKQVLTRDFPHVPAYLVNDDNHLADLSMWAGRQAWLSAPAAMIMRSGSGGGSEPRDPTKPPAPDKGTSPSRIDPKVVQQAIALVKKVADCLLKGQWSIERVWGLPIAQRFAWMHRAQLPWKTR